MRDFLPVVLLLILLAGLARADRVLIILYIIVILYLVTRWWSRRAIHAVSIQRNFSRRAFLEQIVPVSVTISNRSWLPVIWLQIHESLPVEMVVPGFFSQVISLGSRQTTHLSYTLQPHKRGYYPIGPAFVASGDLLGMGRDEEIKFPPDSLIVYPQIVDLGTLGLSSRAMFGSIRENNPAYEDPSRLLGKRSFINGDSLRKVDWKATAASGSLQVKLFEASKALNLVIFLDLNRASYDFIHHYDQTELAIVAAASLANWAIRQKHMVGLVTNGKDPCKVEESQGLIVPRRGSAQLMHLLELLARIQISDADAIPALVNRTCVNLPWGTTLMLITGAISNSVMEALIRARQRGLNICLMNIGVYPGLLEVQRRARHSGFSVFQIQTPLDLDHLGG